MVYVPEIVHDTTYVYDTTYVSWKSSFGLATNAGLRYYSTDSLRLTYWYSLTKLDSTPVDSVFLTGYLFGWSSNRTNTTMMDSTTVAVYPDNAGSWMHPYEYSMGEFDATNRWHLADWSMNEIVTYSIGLGYK